METVVIVAFDEGAAAASSLKVLRELGLKGEPDPRCRWHGEKTITVLLDRSVAAGRIGALEGLPGVRRVRAVSRERGLAGWEPGQPACTVALGPGGVRVGGKGLAVIAGPCSVESAAQICDVAAELREAGASALRGGIFKPRTSPYTFGGLGGRGLELLALAREKTGLPVVTEALSIDELDPVAEYADVLQVGARNMQNFPLLFRAGSHPSGKPILLKRGFGATVNELLQAAEYILLGRFSAGHKEPGLILCERGIRTFEPSTRFTLDVGAIPVLQERTHLPVIADPSHAAGARRYVPPLAKAAVAAGASGILVEVHCEPGHAWSDEDQCLEPREFKKLMKDLRRLSGTNKPIAR